ncbi:MAG: hypothetical protein ACRBBW_00420 [Cellvibrionaceae bacterium]
MDIRNCNVKYKCFKRWSTLIATSEDSIRYCDHCDRGVHFCRTKDELMTAMEKDLCVAIPIDSHDTHDPFADDDPFELNKVRPATATDIDLLAELPESAEPEDGILMGDIAWTEPDTPTAAITDEPHDLAPRETPTSEAPNIDDFTPKK